MPRGKAPAEQKLIKWSVLSANCMWIEMHGGIERCSSEDHRLWSALQDRSPKCAMMGCPVWRKLKSLKALETASNAPT